jgi:hypothetical protein
VLADIHGVAGARAQMLHAAFSRVCFAHQHAEFEPGLKVCV